MAGPPATSSLSPKAPAGEAPPRLKGDHAWLARLARAFDRASRIHLWGKRRSYPPPLTGEEAIYAKLEAERAGANLHIIVTGYMGLLSGAVASALVAVGITAPASLPAELLSSGPSLLLLGIMWLAPALLWPLLTRVDRHWPPQRSAEQVRSFNRKLRWGGALGTGALALLLMLAVVDEPPMLAFGGLAVAGAMFGVGVSWRSGRDVCCRRCGYPIDGPPPRWTRCSECGSDLTAAGAAQRGLRERRPWLAGLAMCGWAGCVWALALMLSV